MKYKKGSLVDPFIWMVASFIIIVLAAVFLYAFGQLTDALIGIDTGVASANVSEAAQNTFGFIDASLQQLRWWTFAIMLALGLSIFLSNFLVKVHPVFFVFYIMIVFIAIIVSIFISDAYESLLRTGVLADTLLSFRGTTWIFLNLPIWMTVIGIGGGIFQFIGIIRDSGQGGGLG